MSPPALVRADKNVRSDVCQRKQGFLQRPNLPIPVWLPGYRKEWRSQKELLDKVAACEKVMTELGFSDFRVRVREMNGKILD